MHVGNCTHVQACPRVPTSKVLDQIPLRFFERLEQDQLLSSCCRHPENHEIEARWLNEEQRMFREGKPDIYIFHCTCGREHIFLWIGDSAFHPFWKEQEELCPAT